MFHTNPRSQEFLHVCAEESPHNIPASELAFSYQTTQTARAPEPTWKQPSQLQGKDKFSQCHETGGRG